MNICIDLSLLSFLNYFRNTPLLVAQKVEKPMSNFVDKLIEFGEDKVKEALDNVTSEPKPNPPLPR